MPNKTFRQTFVSCLYKDLLKKALFMRDPEAVHDFFTAVGQALGSNPLTRNMTSWLFDYENVTLRQKISGIEFKNPIGLAAGFDKDGKLVGILPAVGFGFMEIGSVTGNPCPGNPKPRLWRLQKSKSLLVHYGLKNQGSDKISRRLTGRTFGAPLGISIAKTNSPETVDEDAGIGDYVKAYKTFIEAGIGDYFTVNISCPNAFGGEPFTDPAKLDRLLSALRQIKNDKPLFLKLPSEYSKEDLDQAIEVARKHKVAGFVSTNLAKSRNNKHLLDKDIPTIGGISGKAVQELSDWQVSYLYKKTCGEFVIIGCGGVFTAEDAYKKIRLGASLIQMITGMIYEGPQVIGQINQGLAKLLKKDGFTNISQAIGIDSKKN